ncbi:MAG: hypothetical protein MI741_18385, partial [Rhodospirillales bacterium]|nr:hypothetical protein [Rhodospirillales bacterium]
GFSVFAAAEGVGLAGGSAGSAGFCGAAAVTVGAGGASGDAAGCGCAGGSIGSAAAFEGSGNCTPGIFTVDTGGVCGGREGPLGGVMASRLFAGEGRLADPDAGGTCSVEVGADGEGISSGPVTPGAARAFDPRPGAPPSPRTLRSTETYGLSVS